ncbi:Protein NipSnap, partial [Stegodyphus mimosarum]
MSSLLNRVRHMKTGLNTSFQRSFRIGSSCNSNSDSWFSKLLMVRKIDPGHDSHSRLLSASEIIYEMQTHDVKPEKIEPYLEN